MPSSSGNSAEANFNLNLESNGGEVAEETARALEDLRAKIGLGNDSIKQMGAAFRSLRGSSDQVKNAKAELSAKIAAERDAISAANLKLLEQGTNYEKLGAQARKLAKDKADLEAKSKGDALAKQKAATDALGNAVKMAGGPVESLTGKFDALKGVLGGAEAGMAGIVLAGALVVAALAAIAIGVVALTAKFLNFIAVTADANRSLNLMREGAAGSEQNAKNLGTQVDALASKVPTSRAEINKLGVELIRTRLSGAAIVDTMNIVGQASSAMGDGVGKSLQDIVTRGQMFNRFRLNPMELQGTGVQFNDVAGALAKQLNIGVAQAKQALYQGQVKLDDGAKALRTVVEKNFGKINADKMISLTSATETFEKRLSGLASDVHIDGLLEGIDELSKEFDSSTVSGAALKQLVTFVGNEIGPAFKAAVPLAKELFENIVIGALDVQIWYLRLRNSFEGAFGRNTHVTVTLLRGAVELLIAPFKLLSMWLESIVKQFEAWMTLFGEFKKLGSAIGIGVATGIKDGESSAAKAAGDLATKVKSTFADDLEIHSPSRVFHEHGMMIAAGAAGGMREGMPRVQSAVEAMVPGGPGGGGYAPRGGGAAPVINVNIDASGASPEAAKALSSPSFLSSLTKAIEDAVHGAGVPSQAEPA